MITQERIGEYAIQAKLGQGGMGVVYLAHQESLDRRVALKVLTAQAIGGEVNIQRFYREARAVAKLNHPNIVQVFSIGEHQGQPFFTMEYCNGKDLSSLLSAGPALRLEETIEVVRSVAKALDTAAEEGIIHRDIKPGNIMVTRTGVVKVMDFGLAKPDKTDTRLTVEGQIIGTPRYLSPEQAMSQEVDTRSDLYSLGCVFFECLTGHPPFEGKDAPAVIYKHIYEPPPEPESAAGPIPGVVSLICKRLLAKKPAERYQQPADLLRDLATLSLNTAAAEAWLAERVRKELERSPSASGKARVAGEPSPPTRVLNRTPGSRGAALSPLATSPLSATPRSPLPPLSPTPPPAAVKDARGSRAALPTIIEDSPFAQPDRTPHAPLPAQPSGSRAAMNTVVEDSPFAQRDPTPKTPVPVRPPSRAERAFMPTMIEESPFKGVALAPPGSQPSPESLRIVLPNQTPSPDAPPAKPASRRVTRGHGTPLVPPPAIRKPPSTREIPPPPANPFRTASGRRMQAPTGTNFRPPSGTQLPVPARTPAAPVPEKPPIPKVPLSFFREKPNGWGYNTKEGHCKYAEGLAAEALPGKDLMAGPSGDCPLCSNWTPEDGCIIPLVLKRSYESQSVGLTLLEEQAEVLCAHGYFEKAVALLEPQIRKYPEKPEGYRALARVYDHPEYDGPDARRAIVLYHRWLELQRQQPNPDRLGMQLMESRIAALQAGGAASKRRSTRRFFAANAPDRQQFRCFYKNGPEIFFALGVLTPEMLCIAKVGEVDPHTGMVATEMVNPMKRATTFIRRVISNKALENQKKQAAEELERLKDASTTDLRKQSTRCIFIGLGAVQKLEWYTDPEQGAAILKLNVPGALHELAFTKEYELEAERAALLVRRVTGK